ncbi:MAG: hypothetical protein JNG83_15045 [Opitutaceae bacterium]|nr:hypothetical protein [Opitutaceae bacterium]
MSGKNVPPDAAPLLARLPADDLAGWLAAPVWPPPALAGVPPLPFRQAWLPSEQPELRPGRVWPATTPTALVVLAELEDHDLVTAARRHNDPLWDLGDVFEIFVRHTARPEYWEFHTAPNGVTLDLRYPRLYADRSGGVERYLLESPHFTAQVAAEPARNRWRIAARIPVAPLVPAAGAQAEAEWQLSFCRYDCGPGRAPVFSSTSAHRLLDFHAAHDWPRFRSRPFA